MPLKSEAVGSDQSNFAELDQPYIDRHPCHPAALTVRHGMKRALGVLAVLISWRPDMLSASHLIFMQITGLMSCCLTWLDTSARFKTQTGEHTG